MVKLHSWGGNYRGNGNDGWTEDLIENGIRTHQYCTRAKKLHALYAGPGILWVTKLRHNGPGYSAKEILSLHRINGYSWHVTSCLQPVC